MIWQKCSTNEFEEIEKLESDDFALEDCPDDSTLEDSMLDEEISGTIMATTTSALVNPFTETVAFTLGRKWRKKLTKYTPKVLSLF